MTLDNLPIGQPAIVKSYQETTPTQISHFLALGIAPETPVQVLRIAPLGCPFQVKIGQSLISIRKAEAASVVISPETIAPKVDTSVAHTSMVKKQPS